MVGVIPHCLLRLSHGTGGPSRQGTGKTTVTHSLRVVDIQFISANLRRACLPYGGVGDVSPLFGGRVGAWLREFAPL
jgi:hypothetical protein